MALSLTKYRHLLLHVPTLLNGAESLVMIHMNFKYVVYSTMVASYTTAHARTDSSSAMLKTLVLK